MIFLPRISSNLSRRASQGAFGRKIAWSLLRASASMFLYMITFGKHSWRNVTIASGWDIRTHTTHLPFWAILTTGLTWRMMPSLCHDLSYVNKTKLNKAPYRTIKASHSRKAVGEYLHGLRRRLTHEWEVQLDAGDSRSILPSTPPSFPHPRNAPLSKLVICSSSTQ